MKEKWENLIRRNDKKIDKLKKNIKGDNNEYLNEITMRELEKQL